MKSTACKTNLPESIADLLNEHLEKTGQTTYSFVKTWLLRGMQAEFREQLAHRAQTADEAERLAAEAAENATKHPNVVDFAEAKERFAAQKAAKLAKQRTFRDGPRVA